LVRGSPAAKAGRAINIIATSNIHFFIAAFSILLVLSLRGSGKIDLRILTHTLTQTVI
jgi:hypothetical protein